MTLAAPHFAPPHPVSRANGFVTGRGFAGFPYHHPAFYPLGYSSNPFFYDDLYSSGYPVAAVPPVIILQAPPPPSADFTPGYPPSPAQPLVIELRGDRYVRISGEEDSGAEVMNQGSTPSRRPANLPVPASSEVRTQELIPATLIFRDGHREEVSDYTIADGVLYAGANLYTDGSWNRKIELSSLNLPATIKSNQSRGVRFQLPSSPNEVIVRP
jgi:hypothetical protein